MTGASQTSLTQRTRRTPRFAEREKTLAQRRQGAKALEEGRRLEIGEIRGRLLLAAAQVAPTRYAATLQGAWRLPFVLLALVCVGFPVSAQDPTTNTARSFADFALLAQRNIFDSERVPYRPAVASAPTPKPVETDRIALLGTLTDGGERVAFVEGTRSDYPKTLRLGDKIDDLLVSGISTDGIRIEESTRTLHLPVGSALERKEKGPWQVGEKRAGLSSGSSTPSASPVPSASSGSAADVLKRLMEKRQKETQQ